MVEHARAVVIGGGVGGTSIAYHLAERGWTEVVLQDRAELTSGSTFHWSPAIGAEALAARQTAALFDQSSFAKVGIGGPGALGMLQALCVNDIDRPVRSVVYTAMCNRRGGIECECTVARLADDRFLVETGTSFGTHDLGWIRRHAPSDGRSIAFAYLPPDVAGFGTRGEVEVFGEWIGFEVVREPLWDPTGERIRS